MTPHIPAIVWTILKIITLIGIGVYSVFAWIMVRQEKLMAHVLEEEFEPVLRLLTYIHLGCAVALFLLTLILL